MFSKHAFIISGYYYWPKQEKRTIKVQPKDFQQTLRMTLMSGKFAVKTITLTIRDILELCHRLSFNLFIQILGTKGATHNYQLFKISKYLRNCGWVVLF